MDWHSIGKGIPNPWTNRCQFQAICPSNKCSMWSDHQSTWRTKFAPDRHQYRANLESPLTYQSGVNPYKFAIPIPICQSNPDLQIEVILVHHQRRQATAKGKTEWPFQYQLQQNWHSIGRALPRIGKSHANPRHLEDNCVSNLLNKVLCGSLVGLLGGRIGPHS